MSNFPKIIKRSLIFQYHYHNILQPCSYLVYYLKFCLNILDRIFWRVWGLIVPINSILTFSILGKNIIISNVWIWFCILNLIGFKKLGNWFRKIYVLKIGKRIILMSVLLGNRKKLGNEYVLITIFSYSFIHFEGSQFPSFG